MHCAASKLYSKYIQSVYFRLLNKTEFSISAINYYNIEYYKDADFVL